MELTSEQIDRQDYVDNAIYNLIQDLNPTDIYIDWDIEFIGDIRDVIKSYFVSSSICSDLVFYPEAED